MHETQEAGTGIEIPRIWDYNSAKRPIVSNKGSMWNQTLYMYKVAKVQRLYTGRCGIYTTVQKNTELHMAMA
jgi:hypothetical protein